MGRAKILEMYRFLAELIYLDGCEGGQHLCCFRIPCICIEKRQQRRRLHHAGAAYTLEIMRVLHCTDLYLNIFLKTPGNRVNTVRLSLSLFGLNCLSIIRIH